MVTKLIKWIKINLTPRKNNFRDFDSGNPFLILQALIFMDLFIFATLTKKSFSTLPVNLPGEKP